MEFGPFIRPEDSQDPCYVRPLVGAGDTYEEREARGEVRVDNKIDTSCPEEVNTLGLSRLAVRQYVEGVQADDYNFRSF
ncbi:MAG: hypothetical protein ACI9QC_000757 [Oceanicoccus sp.]|jgi:hypothetical protein